MRVGVLTSALGGGGAERQAHIWTRLLSEWGHEVTALALWPDAGHSEELPDIRVVHLPKGAEGGLLRLTRRLREAQRELDALIVFEPYLAVCAMLTRPRIPWMVVTGKVPQVLTVGTRIPKALYRLAFARATFASAPNQAMVDSYRAHGIRAKGSWSAIPNIADDAAFVDLGGSRQGVLWVGRLETVKNPILAVECAAAADLPLTMLGFGDLQPRVEAAIAASGHADSIELLPFNGEPWKSYGSHRVLMVTSRFESFGNVIVESLAAGTPVVSVDCDFGPRGIIGDATYSTLVEPTVAALTASVRAVLDRPYGEAEEAECRAIAEHYRADLVAPLIADAVERLSAR